MRSSRPSVPTSRAPDARPLLVAGLAALLLLVLLVTRMDAPAALGLALAALGTMVILLFVPFTGVLLGVFILYTNLPAGLIREGIIPDAAAAVVGILFVPAILQQLVAHRQELRTDRTFGLMVAFLAVMLISAVVNAVDVPLALAYLGTYLAEGMALYLLVLNTVRDRRQLTRVLAVVVAASAFLASLTLYQTASGNVHQQFFGLAQRDVEHLAEERDDAVARTGLQLEDRSRGPTDDANRYAQNLLIAASFALAFFWVRRGGRRALALAALGLILGATLLTYSRGAFLTLIVLLLFLGVIRMIPRKRLAAGMAIGIVLVPVLAPGYVDRVHSIAGAIGLVSAEAAPVEPDGPTRGRTTQMLASVLAYSEHPVLGVGPGQYLVHHSVDYQLRPEIAFRELPVPRRAHNLFTEIAAETGTVGLLIFTLIPALLLRDLWRMRKRAQGVRPDLECLSVGFILAILSYLSTGMFLHLSFQRYFWLLMALAAAAVWIMREELAQEERATEVEVLNDDDVRTMDPRAGRRGPVSHERNGGWSPLRQGQYRDVAPDGGGR